MKIKLRLAGIALAFGCLPVLFSCGSDSNTGNTSQDTMKVQKEVDTSGSKTFYLIPNPEDLFAFLEKGKMKYTPSLLSAPEKEFSDLKSKELNFGVYSADLAYVAAFSQYKETVKYLNSVRKLSEDIGISAVFDESLVKRMDNIISNKDSLKRVTSDAYYDIVKYLEKNKKDRTLALVATGGWIESLYTVTSLIEKFDSKSPTTQLIADQKMVFENLTKYLEQQKADESVKSVLELLAPIKTVFDGLKSVAVDSKGSKASSGANQIVVGGTSRLVIEQDQFNSLKSALASVRGNIVGK